MQRKVTGALVRRSAAEENFFDRDFWRKAGHEARFAAAWEMVIEVRLFRGEDYGGEPGLQRTVQHIQRRAR